MHQQSIHRIVITDYSDRNNQVWQNPIWRRSIFHVLCTRSLECTRTMLVVLTTLDPDMDIWGMGEVLIDSENVAVIVMVSPDLYGPDGV